MALVSDGFRLVVTLIDTAGDSTLLTYDLNSADAAAADTDAAAIMASLAGLTDANISAYSIGEKFIENALTFPVGAEIEDEAFFTGKIVGHPNKSGHVRIPSPVITMFTATEGPGRNIVDMGYAPLVTYLGFFDGSGPAMVSDGEALVVSSVLGVRRKRGTSHG